MCGIFGYFSISNTISKQQLLNALEASRHRGPDNAGAALFDGVSGRYYSAEELPEGCWNSVLAHTRLSIIDLSEVANQPMSNEDNTVWTVYNGEIYNFIEIREKLKSLGHTFKSRTDSEVIIHGYEEWGSDVVEHLRGMFAFAVLDRSEKRLILARDRLGVKPVKYYFDGRTLIFASELKGLIHMVPRNIDAESVNMFLSLKYIPSPRTILQDVRKVSPGQLLEFDLRVPDMKSRKYWRPSFYPKSSLPFDEAKKNFENIFSESVFMRTVSDVPIGVYLSGGMDSSAMVAFLIKNGVENINTFTMKFDRQGYDESAYAKIVADRFHTNHHEFRMPALTYDSLSDIIGSLDEPFGDPSYIPTYVLSKFTANHVKVILSGDGGDELMGGYKRYYIHARGKILDMLPRIKSGFAKMLPPEIDKKSIAGKVQRIAEQLSTGFWGAYLLRFSGLSDSFKRYVCTQDAYESFDALSIDSLIRSDDEFREISDVIERLIWIDLNTYLPEFILTKTDLALMAHSVEGRNPFVDHKLVEYTNMLQPHFKFKDGGKYLLKHILKEYLPAEVINRKKMGFSPPIKYWFRDNIALLHEIFSSDEFISGDIFELDRLHQAIDRFGNTEINISEQLWLIMVLELWRREYKV